jgi:hypothetical protein
MTTAAHILDHWQRAIVDPNEIRLGDWLRDLGVLRQVVSVEDFPATGGSGRFLVVRFAPAPGIEDLVLKIPDTVTVTIWRSA